MPAFHDTGDVHAATVQRIIHSSTDADYIDHLIPVIEKNGQRSAQTSQLIHALDRVSASRDAEIERLCNNNHQDFVTSVNQLQHVREGSISLTGDILSLSHTIEESTQQLAQQKKALVDSRHVRENMDETTSAIDDCLEILRLSNRVHELLAKSQYHAALRALDELQIVHLREVTRFNIAEMIEKSIPATHRKIADKSMDDLNTWLFRVRETGAVTGELAMYCTGERRQRHKDRAAEDPDLARFALNSAVETVADEFDEIDFISNDTVEIDFTPLFEALYVFEIIGEGDRFRHEFINNRRKQKDLLFEAVPISMDHDALLSLLENIAGFMILEQAIKSKTDNIRTQTDYDELWDSMCMSAGPLIMRFLDSIDDDETFRLTKYNIATFSETMQPLVYSVASVDSWTLAAFYRFAERIKTRFTEDLVEIFSTDDYMPMPIEDQEEYDRVLGSCWYEPPETRKVSFPCVFPFSQMYPLCCVNMRNFIEIMYLFSDESSQDTSIIDETIRNSLDDLLCDIVCRTLSERLSSQYPGQIVQILTNIEHLEVACHAVQDLLVGYVKDRSTSAIAGPITLRASAAFAETKVKAERRIFDVVNSKIDDLVETAEYDWLSVEHPDEPLPYMQMLTSYLSNIVTQVLLGLPAQIKAQICSTALAHISDALLALPMEESVHRISRQALTAYTLDVNHLITFVSALGDASLLAGFDQLKQTVALMSSAAISGEATMEEFFDATKAREKYPNVDRAQGAQLLEKIAQGQDIAIPASEPVRAQAASPTPATTAGAAAATAGTAAAAAKKATATAFSNFSSRWAGTK